MALTLRNDASQVERLHIMGQIILYPAVFLLTVGVFIGAIWANVSWGSYWSWDPKEVWALITLIIYALPLHGQSLPLFRKPMFFHIYCVIAFERPDYLLWRQLYPGWYAQLCLIFYF